MRVGSQNQEERRVGRFVGRRKENPRFFDFDQVEDSSIGQ